MFKKIKLLILALMLGVMPQAKANLTADQIVGIVFGSAFTAALLYKIYLNAAASNSNVSTMTAEEFSTGLTNAYISAGADSTNPTDQTQAAESYFTSNVSRVAGINSESTNFLTCLNSNSPQMSLPDQVSSFFSNLSSVKGLPSSFKGSPGDFFIQNDFNITDYNKWVASGNSASALDYIYQFIPQARASIANITLTNSQVDEFAYNVMKANNMNMADSLNLVNDTFLSTSMGVGIGGYGLPEGISSFDYLVKTNITTPSQLKYLIAKAQVNNGSLPSVDSYLLDQAAAAQGISNENGSVYQEMVEYIQSKLVAPKNTTSDAIEAVNNSLKVGSLTPDDVLSIINDQSFVTTNFPNGLSDAGALNYKLSVLTNYVAQNPNADINANNPGALNATIEQYNLGIVSQYPSAPAVASEGSQVDSDMASDYAYNAMQVKMSFQNMSNLIKEDKIVLLEAMKSQIEELENNIQGQAQQDEVNSLKEDYNQAVKRANEEDPDSGLEPID